MNINGIEFQLDIYDADTADRYEQAIELLRAVPPPEKDTRLSDSIRTQCHAVFSFFEILFGKGSAEKVFGSSTNLSKCIEATEQVILEVNRQQKTMVDQIERCRPESAGK